MLNLNFSKILIFISISLHTSLVSSDSENLYYKNVIFEQQLIHTITVNPLKYRIINSSAVEATNNNIDSLSRIARKSNALAAINGGFFRAVDNNLFVPAGSLKIANIWHGIAYQARGAIGWSKDGDLVLIDRLKTKTVVQIGNLTLPVHYFNPSYNGYNDKYINSKALLYSSIYPNFFNLNTKYPNILIKQNEELAYIYQAEKSTIKQAIEALRFNAANLLVKVIPQLKPEEQDLWQKVDFITSGAPVLIKNYQPISNYLPEKISYDFINGLHQRTAVCILENGFWKFIVTSSGMTIPTLIDVAQSLQCKDAINLDGGSSSSMYLSKFFIKAVPDFTYNMNAITDAILILSE